jgi:hypothetical protein
MRVLISFSCRIGLAILLVACSASEPAKLERALVGRGRVAVLGDVAATRVHSAGTQLIAESK